MAISWRKKRLNSLTLREVFEMKKLVEVMSTSYLSPENICKALKVNFMSELISMGYYDLESFSIFKEAMEKKIIKSDIRKEIAYLRKKKGFSMQLLSDETGVSPTTVKSYESRRNNNISLEGLYLVSVALNVPFIYIIIREDVISFEDIENFLNKKSLLAS